MATNLGESTTPVAIGPYEVRGLLGGGAVTRVYRAYDRRLQRPVALKVIISDEADLIERFLREARLQARIDHPHVCRVYEAGVFEGRPYIAMQYVAGQTLGAAAESMTLEEKVRVFVQVCEGVHAAHREGLIHRDLKPSNIMVERTADGAWHAYVLDFGLAREQAAPSQTASGVVLGTPYYMAPEQVRGERTLDRRVDVYALGATFYEVLTGRPPFTGTTALEVLARIVEEDPPPLRRWVPHVPVELEAIVLKCLEKDPARRYESARALEADLRRYLDGEPVLARSAGLTTRLRRWVRRRRKALALVGAAAVLAFGGAGWGLYSRWQVWRQARLIQELAQEVERIEALGRFVHMAYLHDVRGDYAEIRARMGRIEARMGRVGTIGEGPGHYALGRGWMVLGDWDRARDHLERAWAVGYRTPEVAYALGRTLGELYWRELREAEKEFHAGIREARRAEARRRFGDRAIRLLRQAVGLTWETPAYGEALIAFYEGRYDEALRKAQAAYQTVRWLYEAHRLEGDVYRALGDEAQGLGRDAEAEAMYRRAEAAYEQAIRLGGSDAANYQRLCALQEAWLLFRLYGSGGDVEPYFRRGVQACTWALMVDPDRWEAYRTLGGLYVRYAQYQADQGDDPSFHFHQALEALRTALRLHPADESMHAEIGNVYLHRGAYEMASGRDPRPSYRQALEAYGHALRVNPRYAYAHNAQGLTHTLWGAYELRQGGDPGPHLRQAVEACRRALAIYPAYAYALNNLGLAYHIQGAFDVRMGRDPDPAWDRAIEALTSALRVNARFYLAAANLGNVYRYRAVYREARRQDPRPDLEKALAFYRQALEVHPQDWEHLTYAVTTALDLARLEVQARRDPRPYLTQARAWLKGALPFDHPRYARPWACLSLEADLLEARWQRRNGPTSGPHFRRLETRLRQDCDG